MGGGCHSGFVTAALGLLEPSCDSQNVKAGVCCSLWRKAVTL